MFPSRIASLGGDVLTEDRYSILFTDSNDEYIAMDNNSSPTSIFSISVWIKKVGSGGWDTIYSAQSEVLLRTNGQEAIRFNVGGSSNRIQSADGVLSLNTWHHIVATYSSIPTPDEAKLYLDGELLSTTLTGTLDIPTTAIAYIGRETNGGGTNFFDGYIGEVAWWMQGEVGDGVLDAAAVRAIYNRGLPIDLSKDSGSYDLSHRLQFWMRMGYQDTFPIIKDHATLFGHTPQIPNNGRMKNMTSDDIVTEIPKQVKGFDTDNTWSMVFDSGNDEYIDLGDNTYLNLGTENFTISAWVKVGDWTSQNIISKKQDGDYSWKFCSTGVDKLQFTSEGNNVAGPTLTGVGTLTAHEGSWVQVTVVSDRDSYTRLFINGVLDKEVTADTSAVDLDNTGDAYICRLGAVYLDGNVDEVAIWSDALDNDAVRAIYNGGDGGVDYLKNQGAYDNYSSLLSGWWRMGDGDTYPTITDNSTNSNNGTMTNMASDDIVEDTP